ncbi:EXS-like protein [Encephalitozoon hellem]|nr:EXS-like protein [Encephalitozoon hellem]
MRFSNTLRANQVDEWKENYVSYEILKSLMVKDRKEFKTQINEELRKINDFFFLLEKKAVIEKEEIFIDAGISAEARVPNDSGIRIRGSRKKAGCLSDDYGLGRDDQKDRLRISTDGKDELDEERDDEDSKSASTSEEVEDEIEELAKKAVKGTNEKGFADIFKISKRLERRKKEKNIQEFLHAVINIKRFRELNYTGLMKLSKKYDRMYPQERFYDSFSRSVSESYFNKSRRIDDVCRSVKELYTNTFAKNDPAKAKTVFKKLKAKRKADPLISYMSGILGGISLGMMGLINFGKKQMDKELFFSMALLHYGAFLFGISLAIFKRFHINYKFIFNFDVCSSLSSDKYLLLTSLSVFANVVGTWINISFVHLNPYWLLLPHLLVLVIPLRVLYHESRFYLLLVVFRIITLPMSFVRFRHFYFADVGQSLTPCFKKIFFYGVKLSWRSEGCINSFFAMVRFLQCLRRYRDTHLKFPHIANALKYSLSVLVGFAVPLYSSNKTWDLFIYKCMVATVSSIYSSAWDVFIDWGIVRDKMMYPRYAYTCGVTFNLICRFFWVLLYWFKISPLWMAFVEISRRFVWTVFRVEFEHLNNCSEFKSKGSMQLTSRELFYKRDYEADARPNDTETENDSSVA